MTPHSFTKAHSTNTIFRSERDTLRDVFAGSTSTPAPTIPVANKRGRSMAEEAENEEANSDEAPFNTHSTRLAMDLEGHAEHRPVKPLRRNRKTMSDSVLTFGGYGAARPSQMPTAVEAEEEDWSAMMQTEESSSSAAPFQPLDF